jgi:hypothetical protein
MLERVGMVVSFAGDSGRGAVGRVALRQSRHMAALALMGVSV